MAGLAVTVQRRRGEEVIVYAATSITNSRGDVVLTKGADGVPARAQVNPAPTRQGWSDRPTSVMHVNLPDTLAGLLPGSELWMRGEWWEVRDLPKLHDGPRSVRHVVAVAHLMDRGLVQPERPGP